MPSRAILESARPACDKLCGPLSERHGCGRPMRWFDNAYEIWIPLESDRLAGHWVCPRHGNVLSGLEAAVRAGYRPQWVEATA